MGMSQSLLMYIRLLTINLSPQPSQSTPEYPIPDDVEIDHCLAKTNVSQHVESSEKSHRMFFNLPLDSKTLYFLASGTHAVGKIEINTSLSVKDKVVVEVMAMYERPEVAEQTQICRISRGEGENGIGLFVCLRPFIIPLVH
jgi:hypothetical protein